MKLPKKQNGFSLVEVIVALSLIGMIIVVISNLPNAVNLITNSQNESKVRSVAAKKLEDIRALGYENLNDGTTAIVDSKLNGLAGVQAAVVIISCPSDLCLNGELVKKITITISWKENNSPKTFQIVTLVASGGLR